MSDCFYWGATNTRLQNILTLNASISELSEAAGAVGTSSLPLSNPVWPHSQNAARFTLCHSFNVGCGQLLEASMGHEFVGDSAQEHPNSTTESPAEKHPDGDDAGEVVGGIETPPEAKTVAQLTAEIERLLSDRAAVSVWMREPDYVESATLEWFTTWLNRRPLKASS